MGTISRRNRRLLWAFGVSAALVGVACGLDSGSTILGVGNGSDSGGGDDVDGSSSTTGDGSAGSDASSASDATDSFDTGTLPDGAASRHVFANTSSAIYAFDIDTHVVTRELGFSFCGLDGGYDTFDLAVASTRQVFVLPWKTAGQFWLYAVNTDGGCVDVHNGPGTNPGGNDMWVGFQNAGGTDTLYSFVQGQDTLYSYNATGNYITSAPNTLQNPGAKADIACSSTLCYTLVPHDKCDEDPGGGNDCIWSFKNDGSMGTQIGNMSTDKVVGLAYFAGTLYGFANDGSIWTASTTSPSTGVKLTDVTGSGSVVVSSLVWIGAGSIPN